MMIKPALIIATVICMVLVMFIGYEIYADAALYGIDWAMGIVTVLLAVLLYLLVLLSKVFQSSVIMVIVQLLPLFIAMISVYASMKLALKVKHLEDVLTHLEKSVEGIH